MYRHRWAGAVLRLKKGWGVTLFPDYLEDTESSVISEGPVRRFILYKFSQRSFAGVDQIEC
jgi:hypothetical protein